MRVKAKTVATIFATGCVAGYVGKCLYERSALPGFFKEIRELPPGETKVFKMGEKTTFSYTKRAQIEPENSDENQFDLKETLLTIARIQLRFFKGPVAKLSRALLPKHIETSLALPMPIENEEYLKRINYHI